MPPESYQATGEVLKNLLVIAWLLPLAGFAIEVCGGFWQSSRLSKAAAYMAVFCIAGGFVCSTLAIFHWGNESGWFALTAEAHQESSEAHGEVHGDSHHGDAQHVDEHGDHETEEHAAAPPTAFFGTIYELARFGSLIVSVDYYIDSLTLVMFVMVTLIATCIHVFALGYMSDELTDNYVDHQVHVSGGGHLHRPGRYYRFFSYMSLFCFSMLGLVLAGNIFMVFIFWELVGICSYLLIGFYVERKSASTAANKAFIMNRIGDFGFLIGLMVIWTWFGTFRFVEHDVGGQTAPGLFTMIRANDGQLDVEEVTTPDEPRPVNHVFFRDSEGHRLTNRATGNPLSMPYWLLVVAGIGIFAGCIGKSAQFPLQTWLPDAMEGPTPVSALVHSATMVAAGVYLAGRFYPMFTPEVLLTIAYIGCITLFLAATIAVVATDIKRVLAYSTISQLGYMMLAIGVAGWTAGLFHLITHAFFKSLMFLASGSVIVGCHHEQEMPRMGGLLRKMPITALTMLVGVIAISGLAIPGTMIAFSGFHSKDAIVATAFSFAQLNDPIHFLLFLVPLVTAGITAFYMFRLWFYTFWGEPRDKELHDRVHESPLVMTVPLMVLALFAAGCAMGGEDGVLYRLLNHSAPVDIAATSPTSSLVLPWEDYIHGHEDAQHHALAHDESSTSPHATAGKFALLVAFVGTLLAFVIYGARIINPEDIKRQFSSVYDFLVEKWRFDELYDAMFVEPVRVVASWCAAFDRIVIDGILHFAARFTIDVSKWDRKFDEGVVDGLVNLVASVTFAIGRSLRVIQTGQLRQYIMFIAVGVLTLFVLLLALI